MPVRVTTGQFVTFDIVTELPSLAPVAPSALTSRALAEAMLQCAWARDARSAWNLLAEVRHLWRAFGDLDTLDQRRIGPVIDERLRDLDDLLWTLIGEGPFSLTATSPADAANAHAVEVGGKVYNTDPDALIDSTAERLRLVAGGGL